MSTARADLKRGSFEILPDRREPIDGVGPLGRFHPASVHVPIGWLLMRSCSAP